MFELRRHWHIIIWRMASKKILHFDEKKSSYFKPNIVSLLVIENTIDHSKTLFFFILAFLINLSQKNTNDWF